MYRPQYASCQTTNTKEQLKLKAANLERYQSADVLLLRFVFTYFLSHYFNRFSSANSLRHELLNSLNSSLLFLV